MANKSRDTAHDECVPLIVKRHKQNPIEWARCRWPDAPWPHLFPRDIWMFILELLCTWEPVMLWPCRGVCHAWCNWLDCADGPSPKGRKGLDHLMYERVRRMWIRLWHYAPLLRTIQNDRPLAQRWSEFFAQISLRHANMGHVLRWIYVGWQTSSHTSRKYATMWRYLTGAWLLQKATDVGVCVPFFPGTSRTLLRALNSIELNFWYGKQHYWETRSYVENASSLYRRPDTHTGLVLGTVKTPADHTMRGNNLVSSRDLVVYLDVIQTFEPLTMGVTDIQLVYKDRDGCRRCIGHEELVSAWETLLYGAQK